MANFETKCSSEREVNMKSIFLLLSVPILWALKTISEVAERLSEKSDLLFKELIRKVEALQGLPAFPSAQEIVESLTDEERATLEERRRSDASSLLNYATEEETRKILSRFK
ncbi:MAG: hypothetical protein HGA38_03310 [Candidatus Moranbacteria bacterium]|nr:hypothetical protein [Candidatus Moranbacteria bacterium]